MKKITIIILLLSLCFISCSKKNPGRKAVTSFEWTQLPALPDREGFAGAFIGRHNDALIVAGGANFPDKRPWEDGKKVWYDTIYVMIKTAGEETGGTGYTSGYTWQKLDIKLPRALAYGVAVSVEDGVICMGGCDSEKSYSDVFLLKWNKEKQAVDFESLPSLPQPLSFMNGAKLGNAVYLVCGQEEKEPLRNFWQFDLTKENGKYVSQWKELPPFPGEARIIPTVAVQNSGMANCLYLFSGRTAGPLHEMKLFTDSWAYHPGKKKWERKTDIMGLEKDGTTGVPAVAAPASAMGAAHILVFGGAGSESSSVNERIENAKKIHNLQQKAEKESQNRFRYLKKIADMENLNKKLMANDKGFRTKILSYHTITDTWVETGNIPAGYSSVTTKAVKLGKHKVVIPTGEIKPGVRTPTVSLYTRKVNASFGWFNYTLLGLYLSILVGMGIYFSRREKSKDDFFFAGRRIPWWAAGLSIYATQLSAITFVSTPAVSFGQNWLTYLPRLSIFMMALIVISFYLPFFRRLNLTTAYEYLERRFSLAVRLFGCLSFSIFQLGRMGVVVYLPALALSTITGMNIYLFIMLMGILSITYTVLGGMEAVIWTDVLQTGILLGGMIILVVTVIADVGGVSEVFRIGSEAGKLTFFDFNFSLKTMNSWLIIIGIFALQFGPYTTDQAVIQRYMTTKDEKSAAKSIMTNGIMAIPGSFLFFTAGLCLFAFFKKNPGFLAVGMARDEVLPLFVSNHLPIGISGVVIAGIFAAAMSSLDSSMHSVATAVTTDFYARFKRSVKDIDCLNMARRITVIVGLLGTLFACYLAGSTVDEMYFTFQKILGMVSSSLVGIFILGLFTKRAHAAGALTGGITAFGLIIYVKYCTPLHFYTYAVLGIVTCIVVGYIASLVIPSPGKDISGLTYKTIKKHED